MHPSKYRRIELLQHAPSRIDPPPHFQKKILAPRAVPPNDRAMIRRIDISVGQAPRLSKLGVSPGFFICLFLALAFSLCNTMAQTNSYLRDHALTRDFMLGRPTRAKPTPDGKAVLFLRSEPRVPKLQLYEFDVTTKQTRLLLSPEQLLKGAAEHLSPEEKARRERARVSVGGFTSYELSRDGARLLLSLSGKLYVYERASGKIQELKTSAGTILDPLLSPDGNFVSYVLDNDVYVFDLTDSKERRLTTGGTDLLSHGLAEFVAQEEMNRFHGYWWSPDSKQIVFQETDASDVETWFVADPIHPEQPPLPSFYPRPGKANVRVRLGIVSVNRGEPTWLKWDNANYPYLTKVTWEEGAPLCITVQTRDQTEVVLLSIDPQTSKTKLLVAERDKTWVNLDQSMPRWLPDGSGFLWTTEREGAWQLDLRSTTGQPTRTIVPPNMMYRGFIEFDPGSRKVIFNASTNPTELHVHSISLDGGHSQQLTHGSGLFGASYNTNLTLSVRSSSTPEHMPITTVYDADGKQIGELPSVAETPPFTPRAEIVQLKEARGMFAKILRPQNFKPGQKYPTIVYVYGGPHSIVVNASMAGDLLHQWLADQGFIVVSIDNRGTPGRGRAWEREIHKKFGSVPIEDQVAGLQALAKIVPEIDLNRVGITGWSFGGYMSALAALRRPDIYKAAVAGAPVTDFLDYDTHYTERYMGLPDADPEGYKEANLLNYANKLDSALLLLHGTADDNVYFRHTLKLVDDLFRNGQHFEVLPLSGLTHMVPDPVVTERLWTLIAAHFENHLAATK
jgi:dipeptidyl-peptidase-4